MKRQLYKFYNVNQISRRNIFRNQLVMRNNSSALINDNRMENGWIKGRNHQSKDLVSIEKFIIEF